MNKFPLQLFPLKMAEKTYNAKIQSPRLASQERKKEKELFATFEAKRCMREGVSPPHPPAPVPVGHLNRN